MRKNKLIMIFFLFLNIYISADDDNKKSLIINKIKNNDGKRIAICIGINEFLDSSITTLSKARNDAKGLGNILKNIGQFDNVFIMTDDLDPRKDKLFPYRANILSKIDNIVELCQPNDLILLLYSSHGVSDTNGDGYLITFDSISNNIFETSVKVSDIVSKFQKKKLTKTLLLLDACRESFEKSKGLNNSGLKEKIYKNAEVAATFYATKQGLFSYEDPESEYGSFTRFLIDGMKGNADKDNDGLVTFSEIETFVAKSLTEWSFRNGKNQLPYTKIYGEKYGDLILSEYKIKNEQNSNFNQYSKIDIDESIQKAIEDNILKYINDNKSIYKGYDYIDKDKYLTIYKDMFKKMGKDVYNTWNEDKAIYENSKFTILTSEFLDTIMGSDYEIMHLYQKQTSSGSGIIHNYIFTFIAKREIEYKVEEIKKDEKNLNIIISFPDIKPFLISYNYSFKRSSNGLMSAIKYFDEYKNFFSNMKFDFKNEAGNWVLTETNIYSDKENNKNTKENFYITYKDNFQKQKYPDNLTDKRKLSKEMFNTFLLGKNNITSEELKKCIDDGSDINYKSDETGNSMLYIASANNNINCVKILIDFNADINIVNNQNQTPLLIASAKGYYEIVKILLENGANPNIQEKDTELTALDNAIAGKYIKSESSDSIVIELSIGRNDNFKKCADIIKSYGGETYFAHIAIPYKITLERYERDILNKIKDENDNKFICSIYKKDKKHMIIINELTQDEKNRIRKIIKEIKFNSLGHEKKEL